MYNELPSEQLTKESLLQNKDFLIDASEFLRKRTGNFYTDPNEVFDAYMNHMRWHSTNDVTPFRDLRFAQDADPDMKARMARLFQTYDTMEVTANDDIVEAAKATLDFGGSILSSPSTWVGLLTSGAGKVAALGGQQAARIGVRGLIYKATQAVAKYPVASGAIAGATVEGSAAYSTERARQMGRVETGAQAEEDDTTTIINTLAGTVLGGAAGSLTGLVKKNQVKKANEFFEKAMKAESDKADEAAKVAEETISANKDKEAAVIERLRPLKEEMVEGGRQLKETKFSNNELLMLSLDLPVKKSITAAAIDLLGPEDLAVDSTARITEIVAERIANGTLTSKGIKDIADKYNLSSQQISLIFTADVSDAARTLQMTGQIKKSLMKEQVDKLAKNVQSIANKTEGEGVSFTTEQLDEIFTISQTYDFFTTEIAGSLRGFERMRRAFLTSQVQTTVRNFAGGGARVILDMPEKLFENVIKKTVNTIAGKEVYADDQIYSAFSIAKYISPISINGENRVVADIVSNMFARDMPDSAQRLFGTFMDGTEVARKGKLGTAFESVGASMNFANRFSDNYYKKAIFTGELDRLVRGKYKKSLLQLLEDGEFNKIEKDMFVKATDKAFELLYQKSPKKGSFGDWYLNKLDKHWGGGIVAGMIFPFPRFIFNSIQFMYDHAPVLGLVHTKTFSKEAPERIAKQLTGTAAVYLGYLHSASQGTDKQWYMHRNENGEETDLRPFLGPMALPMYLGDLMNRYWDSSKPLQDNVDSIKNNVDYGTLGELLFGSSFRVGAGAYFINSALPQFAEAVALPDSASDFQKSQAFDKAMGRFAGDYVATLAYNMPTAIARDIYKITDAEARMIGPGDEVTFGDVFRARASRALPQPLREMVVEGKEKRSVITQRYNVTSDKPVKTLDPFSTAVTGLARSRESSRLEKELAKIGYDSYDIYKPLKFGPADVLVRKVLSGNSDKDLPSLTEYISRTLLDRTEYNNADIDAKRNYIKYATQEYVQQIVEDVYEDLYSQQEKGKIDYTIAELYRNHFESKPKISQRAALAAFRQERGRRPNLENEEDLYLVKELAVEHAKQFGGVKYSRGGLVTDEAPQQFNVGGMVGDPLSLSETAEEEDAVSRQQAGEDYVKQMTELGLDMAPVTGEIRSAQAAVEDFEKGNYGMAALGAVGAFPGVGIVGRGAKQLVKKFGPEALDMIPDRVFYHGTMADVEEFDPNLVDIGVHIGGNPTQASDRLKDLADPYTNRPRSMTDFQEGSNIIPLRARMLKTLELEDVGDWKNSYEVANVLRKYPEFQNNRTVQDVMEDADALQAQFYGVEEEFRDSMENRELLETLREIIQDKGYDSIKYINMIEGRGKTLNETGEKIRAQLNKRRSELEEKIVKRAESDPKYGVPKPEDYKTEAELEDAIKQWSYSRPDPLSYATKEEDRELGKIIMDLTDLINKYGNDPYSYIVLDPSQLRSALSAKFDPAARESANLNMNRGGLMSRKMDNGGLSLSFDPDEILAEIEQEKQQELDALIAEKGDVDLNNIGINVNIDKGIMRKPLPEKPKTLTAEELSLLPKYQQDRYYRKQFEDRGQLFSGDALIQFDKYLQTKLDLSNPEQKALYDDYMIRAMSRATDKANDLYQSYLGNEPSMDQSVEEQQYSPKQRMPENKFNIEDLPPKRTVT